MREQILTTLKNFPFLNENLKEIEECQIQSEYTHKLTFNHGWESTWVKIQILCPNEDIQKILNTHKELIEAKLRNSVDFGENYFGGKYIPYLEIVLDLN